MRPPNQAGGSLSVQTEQEFSNLRGESGENTEFLEEEHASSMILQAPKAPPHDPRTRGRSPSPHACPLPHRSNLSEAREQTGGTSDVPPWSEWNVWCFSSRSSVDFNFRVFVLRGQCALEVAFRRLIFLTEQTQHHKKEALMPLTLLDSMLCERACPS